MKWEKVFFLLFNGIEDNIYFAANEARKRYRVPPARCYAYRGVEHFWPLHSTPPPFRNCDLDSKLLILPMAPEPIHERTRLQAVILA
ncbi:hypothetical protein Xmau_04115 [Xenorhabdus mauleonii]|uniref:Uncharacterized protein n=1 Tax=Xenorhabdus mauleonii TaxID=351675 RepID=A0A1I3WAN1_9GAMM|nr:hypothetical protein Xmau_04115 [Xenorhabdus mauleonii]SFK04299.1 hypothetical protein SAMN05421680_12519 [Xenorhabdus mauleonii]